MSLYQEKQVVCLYETCSPSKLKKLYKLQALSAAMRFRDAESSFVEIMKSAMSPTVMFVALATLLIFTKDFKLPSAHRACSVIFSILHIIPVSKDTKQQII